ncbi:PucR family transcriptional regulator [Demequina lignilytica]|uniref:Helix-turn-helix domain-containing protein n=1 Tax=Demequina lignilytica TaxID=3051663 RepID=A0AAW7M240_9MICO|nr:MULTISPECIES: helix-turn-helix domain-containing protein [unclassified Demequina]MDN4478523.1 helix-turn-helix domain-containing protein [Demequina sp. SYSU T00039-1]MDN4482319.1 helix-turn-helix domain-containing protein [Demequina sp. SYSU T0a273]MDN4486970.1 helix-turn-helix domain-containing protein [Demequina sp. SYSU T00039]MDN4489654.1 helix-turn-helix domain-containing protein [Demequina sp. SYSU T00068]
MVTAEMRAETLRRLRAGTGRLATAALKSLDAEYPWFRELPARERSWVGGVAQAGINSFVAYFADPQAGHRGTYEMFSAAPPELTRSISLQHTVSIVRTYVAIVESHSDEFAAPGAEALLRESILRYSREIAFSAAEVYARAAESRGAWDARLEALVVDALVRGEVDDDLPSRAAALGWKTGPTVVVVGRTDGPLGEVQSAELRRSIRRAAPGALVGIHGEDLVVIARSDSRGDAVTESLLSSFGPGPVVVGPPAVTLVEVARSTRAAINGAAAAPAWALAPRPVGADDLLPERVLVGDAAAADRLIAVAYDPIAAAGGSLRETVATFLDCGRSLELASRTMFVHANTVRYRLKKVAELTGWDVLSTRDAHVLETAFALGRLRDANSHRL